MAHEAETKVKVCGVTCMGDAELAVSLGAWAIGMIFYEGSPRRCSLEQAEAISRALRRRTQLAGVFVNESLPRIAELAERLQLAIVQLHGDEGPSFCAEVARRTGAKVCKAVQISAAGDVIDLERFHVDLHLADAKGARGQRGGTGSTFDWTLLQGRRSTVPLILSGGMSADNVAEAIATVRPFAVDVASGVEDAPGRKDEAKLRAFFETVRSANAAMKAAA
jgi:phosphoribosylanthranilate isomerase